MYKKTVTKKYIVKTWEELTEAEKQKQIEKDSEQLVYFWSEYLYECFNENLDELKEKLKFFTFDDVFADSNSQGFWIDSIKNLKLYIKDSGKYGGYFVDGDCDITIRKYIDSLDTIYLYMDAYKCEYKDGSYLQGYQTIKELEQSTDKNIINLLKDIKKDFDILKNGINDAVQNYFLSLQDMWDDSAFVDYLDTVFYYDQEFEFEIAEVVQ